MLIRMTRLAILLQMLAGQLVSRSVVIKGVLIKPDNIKVAAVMLAVTGEAVFVRHLCRCVETFPLIDPCLYFFMAIQAFRIGNFIAEVVAFGAIHNAFEVGVVTRQITGRELRKRYPQPCTLYDRNKEICFVPYHFITGAYASV